MRLPPSATLLLWLLLEVRAHSGSQVVVLPKCCPDGQSLRRSGCKEVANITNIEVDVFGPNLQPLQEVEVVFSVRHLSCDNGHRLYRGNWSVLQDGSLLREEHSEPTDEYCIENVDGETRMIDCIVEVDASMSVKEQIIFSLHSIFCLISLPPTIFTIILHLCLEDLQNLSGMIICQILSALAFTYATFVLSGLNIIWPEIHPISCITEGYPSQILFVANFIWLNVLSIIMYWAFSLRNLSGSVKKRERRKLIYYSIFAWGFPFLILLITLGVYYLPLLPSDSVRLPNIAKEKSYYEDNHERERLFLSWSMGLIIINILLFTIMAIKIYSLKRENIILKEGDSRKNVSFKEVKKCCRLSLPLKLFLVMGINWTMELFLFITGKTAYFWCFSDFTNSVLGLFIFVTFLWNRVYC